MAVMERPPVSPQAQAQMGPPGGPDFGPGIAQAQAAAEKSPEELAVQTCEKILMGIPNTAFRPYAMKAIATLNAGVQQVKQQGPQSQGMGTPPTAGTSGGPPQVPGPPVPGPMPG